ncbi:hypothetical protein FCF25_01640 [Haloprofundus sp. MHR1]|nr:hypothetical protein FCF25_01640 [Haloprofundus sp. MHR1]
MNPEHLRDADKGILDELKTGRANAPLLAERLDYSKQYVRERLVILKREGHIRSLGYGLYEFVNDPRETHGED